jgi:hypothetical protein
MINMKINFTFFFFLEECESVKTFLFRSSIIFIRCLVLFIQCTQIKIFVVYLNEKKCPDIKKVAQTQLDKSLSENKIV